MCLVGVSVCVHIYCRVTTTATPTCDLLANTITMSDGERAELMEKFKKHELSESEVLSKVTYVFVYLCSSLHGYISYLLSGILFSKKEMP